MTRFTRREAMLAAGAAAMLRGAAAAPQVEQAIVDRNDDAVRKLMRAQITDAQSPWAGSVPDDYLMHSAGAAGGLVETLAASFACPQSKFHGDSELLDRIRLAARFLERSQSPEGNIDLLSTNFNSPPDTGFVVHSVATAAAIGQLYGIGELVQNLRPFLVKAGAGLAAGGIHTPNHRWVVSSALAQINSVFPDASYVRRIGQWLAEGIDIDGDGQFIERSTVTYNAITDRALCVMAAKLKRPELLAPVRRNFDAMLYLLHPDGEVVTKVSRRQDQYVRGTMVNYWFPLTYLAIHGGDGRESSVLRLLGPEAVRLSALLEYPELAGRLPERSPIPNDYERTFPLAGLARIRRGSRDATMVLKDNSRFFSLRNGAAVIDAVRFATSFFGKGQFVPESSSKEDGYVFRQRLEAPYYQPVSQPVTYRNWTEVRATRAQTQLCRLEQTATVTELKNGFELRMESRGTAGVPLAIEIAFREGGKLEGCRPAPHAESSWLLERDYGVYRVGGDAIRFGPGAAPHLLTQLRGAEPKLPGPCVYITGYTPFDHAIRFEWA
ncbi:MAG: hypothetical protein WBY44_09965 [Bryobacteraceae bacterium]|jgi:hypothetical protein